MRLTRAGEYAVRCVIYLAMSGRDVLVSRKEIASEADIPAQFLAKIAQELAKAGIIEIRQGVGGGFIMVPVMVYLLRMPMHVVVGTSLFQILFTCINVTVMQSYSNHTVDFVLAVLLLLGSTIGAQIGTAASKRLKADQLKIMLASLVLLVCVKMMAGLLMTPAIMVALKGGH